MEVSPKMAILGDMKELGDSSLEEHQKIADYLQTCDFETVLLVGPEFGKTSTPFRHFPDTASLIHFLEEQTVDGKYILIKGSNSMKLSQLAGLL